MAYLGRIKKTDDSDGERLVKRARRGKRLLSEAVQIEQEVVPEFVGTGVLVAAVLVVSFVVWASFAKITEITVATGEVVPTGNVKVVQHLEGGIVGSILVREGQIVEADEVLLSLDAAQAGAEFNQLEARAVALRLRTERLAAFAENRPAAFPASEQYPALIADQVEILENQAEALRSSLAVIDAQIAQRNQRLSQLQQSLTGALRQQELAGEILAMRERLGAKKLVTQVDLLETRRAKATADSEVIRLREEIDVSRQELNEAQMRRDDTVTQTRSQSLIEMGRVRAELAEVESALDRARNRVQRLDVRAPVRGLVQDLKVATGGQVIQPGALLMQIVPLDAGLEAEVTISTRDIGHVSPGDPVVIKVSSYDFARFGGIDGTLRQISATSMLDEKGTPSFRGWVTLSQPYVGDAASQNLVVPGMGVQAEIITGRKTLMSYLFKPINDAFERSFRER